MNLQEKKLFSNICFTNERCSKKEDKNIKPKVTSKGQKYYAIEGCCFFLKGKEQQILRDKFSGIMGELFINQFKNNKLKPRGPVMRLKNLALHFYSTSTYNFIQPFLFAYSKLNSTLDFIS